MMKMKKKKKKMMMMMMMMMSWTLVSVSVTSLVGLVCAAYVTAAVMRNIIKVGERWMEILDFR